MGSKPFAVRIVTAFVLFCSVLAPLVTVTPATARDVPEDVDLAAISRPPLISTQRGSVAT
ncbi:MAG: hypothetical protein R2845_07430 [Thermomicrobiales bacterium]